MKKDTTIYTSFYEDYEVLAEEIYNPLLTPSKQFLLYKKSSYSIDIVPLFTILKDGEEVEVLPLDFNLIENKIVLLPSAIDTKTTEEELDRKILSFIHRWVDIEKAAEQISLYYIKMTWLYDRLTVVPYLRCLGTFGTGKTRTVQTIGSLCYKPLFISGASSDAYLFRTIELFKGTLIVNELERTNTDLSGQLVVILNNGFEKGLGVGRVEGDKNKVPVVYDVFSPKIMSAREPFKDLALESRIITHRLAPTSRKDIPFTLDDAFWKEAEEIRNALLNYRIKCVAAGLAELSLTDTKKKVLYQVEPRLRQTFSPLLYVIPENKLEEFALFAKTYQQEIIEDRGMELEGIVVKCLFRLLESLQKVSVKELRTETNNDIDEERFKITSQKIGKILKALGIKTHPEGHEKVPYIQINETLFEKLRVRFGIDANQNTADPQEPQPDLILADETLVEQEKMLREQWSKLDKNTPEYAELYHKWFLLRDDGITRGLFNGIVPTLVEPYMTPYPVSSLPKEELYG